MPFGRLSNHRTIRSKQDDHEIRLLPHYIGVWNISKIDMTIKPDEEIDFNLVRKGKLKWLFMSLIVWVRFKKGSSSTYFDSTKSENSTSDINLITSNTFKMG